MNKHRYKVSVLKVVAAYEHGNRALSSHDISELLAGIRALPIQLDNFTSTRYSQSGSAEERALVFLDELPRPVATALDFQLAMFIHRRGDNRPYEEDGQGHLDELRLTDDTHQLAEVSCVVFDVTNSVVLWIYNPFVGGLKQFQKYLTDKYNQSYAGGFSRLDLGQYGTQPEIALHYVMYPESQAEFRERMTRLQTLEFQIAGDPERLTEQFLEHASDREGMRMIRHFVEESNCTRLAITISAKQSRGRRSQTASRTSLNKSFVVNLFEATKPYLESRDDSKFNITGDMIDEETKVLDLLHSRLTYPLEVEYNGNEAAYATLAKAARELAIRKREEIRGHLGI